MMVVALGLVTERGLEVGVFRFFMWFEFFMLFLKLVSYQDYNKYHV